MYDTLCQDENKERKAHYTQLKKWYEKWNDTAYTQSNDEEDQGVKSIDNKVELQIVSAEEQLQSKVQFADIFKTLDFNAILQNERRLRVNLPRREGTIQGSPEEEVHSTGATRGSAVEIEAIPPTPGNSPTPAMQSREQKNKSETIEDNENILHTMMARGKWRALQDREQASHAVYLTHEDSFSGFQENDLLTSTPRRLGVLHDWRQGNDSSVERLANNRSIALENVTALNFCSA